MTHGADVPEAAREPEEPKSSTPGGLSPWRLERALAYIDNELARQVSIREIADAAALSPFHFARMFKVATGLPPHRFILAKRIELAKQLMRDTELSIREIAQRVGYRTQSHFTHVFGRATGSTPLQYLESVRMRASVGGDDATGDGSGGGSGSTSAMAA